MLITAVVVDNFEGLGIFMDTSVLLISQSLAYSLVYHP